MDANTLESKYKIAVLDEEQSERNSFINYFEDLFKVVEISESSDAKELAAVIRHQSIDAIAIDYRLMDHGSSFQHNGSYFFKELNKLLIDFPSFILTNNPDNAKKENPAIMPFFIIGKDRITPSDSSLKNDVYQIISNYKSNMLHKTERLRELIELTASQPLDARQEQEYVELNLYLERATYNVDIPSAVFYSSRLDQRISQLIESTQNLLRELGEQNDTTKDEQLS